MVCVARCPGTWKDPHLLAPSPGALQRGMIASHLSAGARKKGTVVSLLYAEVLLCSQQWLWGEQRGKMWAVLA